MQHVKALKSKAVHAARDASTTWCRWKYISDRKLNGNYIPLAATTSEELTCVKCAGVMNLTVIKSVQIITPAESEKVYEFVSKFADESKRNSYSRGKMRRDTTAV